jgi:hypothetical protein
MLGVRRLQSAILKIGEEIKRSAIAERFCFAMVESPQRQGNTQKVLPSNSPAINQLQNRPLEGGRVLAKANEGSVNWPVEGRLGDHQTTSTVITT